MLWMYEKSMGKNFKKALVVDLTLCRLWRAWITSVIVKNLNYLF